MVENTERLALRRRMYWRMARWGAAGLLLLLPWVAMRFTREVAWSPMDFVVWGVMLATACGAYELLAAGTRNHAYRAAAALAVGTAFFLVWSNLAVGLIGSERNPANLMYFGVLAVGLVGAAAARLRPRGMAWALAATAGAMAAVGLLAAAWRMGAPESGPAEILLLTGFFDVLWLASAGLFGLAARRRMPAGETP